MTTILFFGTPQFSVPTLQGLISAQQYRVGAVVTQPDRPAGRGRTLTPPPIKTLALQHDIPVFQPKSLKKEFEALRTSLDALGPFDVGVVVAFGQILPLDVLSYPKKGCINIHASILPRWRGAAPIQRAIAAGDEETGVCLMQMDQGLDTGAVYSCEKTRISPVTTTHELQNALATMGCQLLLKDLSSIVTGSLIAVPQNSEGVTYAQKITSSEALIDWNQSSSTIFNRIRAFSPVPGCFTCLRGKRLKIIKASVTQSSTVEERKPGTVLESTNGQLIVSCGEGSLAIERVKPEGKKEMEISEFLRGATITPGTLLEGSSN